MRFVAISMVVAACTSQGQPEPITGCETCGSGALRAGVMVPDSELVTASANGTSAYTTGNELVWLGSDFQIDGSTTIAPAPQAWTGKIWGLYSDAAGATYVYDTSMDDIDEWESQIGFGADHAQLFRVDAGVSVPSYTPIAGDPAANLALYVAQDLAYGTTSLIAIDPSNGSGAWTTGFRGATQLALAASADGTIGIAGKFTAIALGGNLNPIPGMVIAALDPSTGFAKWAITLSTTSGAVPPIDAPQIAIGSGGEIALAMQVGSDDEPIMLGDQLLTPDASDAAIVAMIDNTGAVSWVQYVPFAVGSVVTDGTVIYTGGGSTIAQLSATGIDWQQTLTGDGTRSVAVHAIANSQLAVSIATSADATGHASVIDGDVEVEGPGTLVGDIALQ